MSGDKKTFCRFDWREGCKLSYFCVLKNPHKRECPLFCKVTFKSHEFCVKITKILHFHDQGELTNGFNETKLKNRAVFRHFEHFVCS